MQRHGHYFPPLLSPYPYPYSSLFLPALARTRKGLVHVELVSSCARYHAQNGDSVKVALSPGHASHQLLSPPSSLHHPAWLPWVQLQCGQFEAVLLTCVPGVASARPAQSRKKVCGCCVINKTQLVRSHVWTFSQSRAAFNGHVYGIYIFIHVRYIHTSDISYTLSQASGNSAQHMQKFGRRNVFHNSCQINAKGNA